MEPLTAVASAGLPGPPWLRRRRAAAFATFEGMALPSEKEELWRYTPIDRLDLTRYALAPLPSLAGTVLEPGGHPEDRRAGSGGLAELAGAEPALGSLLEGLAADLGGWSGILLTVNGVPVAAERTGLPAGVTLGGLEDPAGGTVGEEMLGGARHGADALAFLHDAFLADAAVLEVAAGVDVDRPIVVVHWCDARWVPGGALGLHAPAVRGEGGPAAVFPHSVVRVQRGARAQVFEVLAGPSWSDQPDEEGSVLVVAGVEVDVAAGGDLSYVGFQELDRSAWSLSTFEGTAARDAVLRTFTVSLGSSYARQRTDARATEPNVRTELRSAYFGTGTQVHDIRTLQDHAAAHTSSDLLCKGAVGGRARSVYSGLIRVRRGALRTDAFQTNHNLVLDEGAHADSVPNLDIEENDVRCSHASTVGPLDEDQLYYLESRGVGPGEAQGLIVRGFFDDVARRTPVPGAAVRLRRAVAQRLAEVETLTDPAHTAQTAHTADPTAGADAGGPGHG